MCNITRDQITFKTIDNSELQAIRALMDESNPTNLVIMCHGHTETRHHFNDYFAKFVSKSTMGISISYRNDDDFPVLGGAQDLIYSAKYFKQEYPSIEKIILYGSSMGGAIAGTAIAERENYTKDTNIANIPFSGFVSAAGVTNLVELYPQAALFDPTAKQEIEDDVGGTILTKPDEYIKRSPALRAEDLKQSGLEYLRIVHSKYDGVVLYNQAIELEANAKLHGIDTNLKTLSCFKGEGDPGATIYSDLLIPSDLAAKIANCCSILREGGNTKALKTLLPGLKEVIEKNVSHPSLKLLVKQIISDLDAAIKPLNEVDEFYEELVALRKAVSEFISNIDIGVKIDIIEPPISLCNSRIAGHVNTADINNPVSKAGLESLCDLLREHYGNEVVLSEDPENTILGDSISVVEAA